MKVQTEAAGGAAGVVHFGEDLPTLSLQKSVSIAGKNFYQYMLVSVKKTMNKE